MIKSNPSEPASAEEERIAERLVRARLEGRALVEYPGVVPTELAAAYRIQDAAIRRWPDSVGGWKVTMYTPPEQRVFGEERFMGPAFSRAIYSAASGQVIDIPLIGDGQPGVESEIVIRINRDAPPDKIAWTVDEAAEMVGDFCIGVEVVSSALSTQMKKSGLEIISDFCLNNGIVVGPAIPQWRTLNEVATEIFVDGEPAPIYGRGATPVQGPGGPLGALAYALGLCARRGYPLKAGTPVSTGTLTGNQVNLLPGQSSRHVFEGLGEVLCRGVPTVSRYVHDSRGR